MKRSISIVSVWLLILTIIFNNAIPASAIPSSDTISSGSGSVVIEPEKPTPTEPDSNDNANVDIAPVEPTPNENTNESEKVAPVQLQLLSPNGGETWQTGNLYSIQWSYPEIKTPVDIYLTSYVECDSKGRICLKRPSIEYALAKSVKNNGLWDWQAGTDINGREIPEGAYMIQITDAVSGQSDGSDQPFKLTSTASPYVYVSSDPVAVDGSVQILVNDPIVFTALSEGGRNDLANWIWYYDMSVLTCTENPALPGKLTLSCTGQRAGDTQVWLAALSTTDPTAESNRISVNVQPSYPNYRCNDFGQCVIGGLGSYCSTDNDCVTQNLPPVIHGVSGPTLLQAHETGIFTVSASDPENGPLSYSVYWGDEYLYNKNPVAEKSADWVQTALFSHYYSQPGDYFAFFTVQDQFGLTAFTGLSVHVEGDTSSPLYVTASASPDMADVPFTTTFSANVNGGTPPYSYQWSVYGFSGEVAASNSASFNHNFQYRGIYTGQVTVQSADNQVAVDEVTVLAGPAPVAPYNLYAYNDFPNGISLSWDDTEPGNQYNLWRGDCGSDSNCNNIFSANNTWVPYNGYSDFNNLVQGDWYIYNVSAVVNGWSSPASYNVIVQYQGNTNLPPVIHSVSGPTVLNVNETGIFVIQASDPENGPLSYSVYWGDEYSYGKKKTGEMPTNWVQTALFSHSYSQPGDYFPFFYIQDQYGQYAYTGLSVHITGGADLLQVEATANPSNVNVNGMVTFNAETWGGLAPYSYDWHVYGYSYEVTSSQQQAFSHVFPYRGLYSAQVSVTSADNQTALDDATFTVGPKPMAPANINTNSSYPYGIFAAWNSVWTDTEIAHGGYYRVYICDVGLNPNDYCVGPQWYVNTTVLNTSFTHDQLLSNHYYRVSVQSFLGNWFSENFATSTVQYAGGSNNGNANTGGIFRCSDMNNDGTYDACMMNGTGPMCSTWSDCVPSVSTLTVRARANPESANVPFTTSFSSNVNGGTAPYSYHWSVYGFSGEVASSNAATFDHTFQYRGIYSGQVTVHSQDNQNATDTVAVRAGPEPLTPTYLNAYNINPSGFNLDWDNVEPGYQYSVWRGDCGTDASCTSLLSSTNTRVYYNFFNDTNGLVEGNWYMYTVSSVVNGWFSGPSYTVFIQYEGNVNQPPVVHSVYGPTVLNVNDMGVFTVSASDPENGPLSYSVYWGDEYLYNKNASPSTPNNWLQTALFTHVYTQPGDYFAFFTVQDQYGQSAFTGLTIHVTGSSDQLEVWANASPEFGNAPLNVTFDSQAWGGVDPYSYSWHLWGSNLDQFYSGQVFQHTFTERGLYSAQVTVRSADNQMAVATTGVRVGDLPVIATNFNGTSVYPNGIQLTWDDLDPVYTYKLWRDECSSADYCYGYRTTLLAETSDNIYTDNWNLAPNKYYRYELTSVINGLENGDAQTTEKYSTRLSSGGNPCTMTAQPTISASKGRAPLPVEFRMQTELTNCTSQSAAVSWNFGDGQSSNEASTNHVYSQGGLYTATWRAEANGISQSGEITILVRVPRVTIPRLDAPRASSSTFSPALAYSVSRDLSLEPESNIQEISAPVKVPRDQRSPMVKFSAGGIKYLPDTFWGISIAATDDSTLSLSTWTIQQSLDNGVTWNDTTRTGSLDIYGVEGSTELDIATPGIWRIRVAAQDKFGNSTAAYSQNFVIN